MQEKIIGTATIGYDENGKVTHAAFVPVLEVELNEEQIQDLKSSVEEKNNPTDIKENADMVLATWFSYLNDIELADRNEFHVVSTVVNCDKHSNGKVKLCVIRYSFEKVKSTTAVGFEDHLNP